MAHKGATGIRRIINATRFSMQGLRVAFVNEAAFRQECFLALLLTPLGLYLGDGGLEKALLTTTLLLVLIVELLNSAVEAVVDRVGDEIHELSGWAKDLGSAAVFIALANVLVVWALVLLV